jgi:hypothetical protein
MQNFVFTGLASFLIGLGLAGSASAMGGMGGPSDAWGSPYVLLVPQSVQAPTWKQDRATEGRTTNVGEGKSKSRANKREHRAPRQ